MHVRLPAEPLGLCVQVPVSVDPFVVIEKAHWFVVEVLVMLAVAANVDPLSVAVPE